MPAEEAATTPIVTGLLTTGCVRVAPMICAWYALLFMGLRTLWIKKYFGCGRAAVRALLTVCLIVTALRIATFRFPWSHEVLFSGSAPVAAQLVRASVSSHLHEQPGNHLVIVRYNSDHNPHTEWVYNDADIDGAKVVWARDMGTAKNQELLDYYKDRRVWLVEPDEKPVRVTPFEGNL